MEKVVFNNGIKRYAITDENDNLLAEVVIDATDNTLIDRFAQLYDDVKTLYSRVESKIKLYENQSELSINDIRAVNDFNSETINELIEKLEGMSGSNLVHDVFRENYALNKDYVPSVNALQSLLDIVMPIIEQAFEENLKNGKYSPNKA